MRIVADQRIPFVDLAFGQFGYLVKLDSRAIDNSAVKNADAVIVRSETEVDEKLLLGSKVSFVGTATIGTDHVDLDLLKRHGIAFASAPGSNANAVAEYVFTALFTIAKRNGFALRGKVLGVVGVGNTGSKVVRIAERLGMNVLQNDPPLARRQMVAGNHCFLSLDDLMQADFITLHVPLTRSGLDPTLHLFDEKRLSAMKSGSLVINTSRGGVVETIALKKALTRGTIGGSVLDVWENEPNIDVDILSLSSIATPHIAGYSIDGKVNATKMIYQAFCEHFGLPQTWDASTAISESEHAVISVDGNPHDAEEVVAQVVKQCYEIESDDKSLRKIVSLTPAERGTHFKKLRSDYCFRHEFSNTTIVLSAQNKSLSDMFASFGFKIRYSKDIDRSL